MSQKRLIRGASSAGGGADGGGRPDRRRMLTVWCPHWPVVAAGIAGAPVRRPAIVLHANRVVAASLAATAAGVAIGQRRRVAQQRCPEAVLLDHDPDRDARLFDTVVAAVGELTPRVEVVEPGWLCVEARGPSRYFGGDEALGERLVATIGKALGRARSSTRLGIGVADGRFASAVAARLAARRSADDDRAARPVLVVAPGGSAAYLAPQPVAWLQETGEVDAELVSLFARLGLSTLGAVAALGRSDLADRFGPPGEHAHRLAAGADDRPAHGVEPSRLRHVERCFEEPVEQLQPLVFVGKQLADELTAELALAGLTCTRLVVIAETEHGERSERVWFRGRGLSATAMVERIRWQLDGWIRGTAVSSGPSAGVVLLRLDPDELRHDAGDQLRLWGGLSAADERAVRTVTRLAGLAGEQAVVVPVWQGGRLPGDRYRWVPATTTDLTDADDTAERLRPRLGGSADGSGRSITTSPRRRTAATRRAAGADSIGEAVAAAARRGPWPGALPAPSPAVVLRTGERAGDRAGDRAGNMVDGRDGIAAVVADEHGRPVSVGGRGELSATPATLAIAAGPAHPISGWAGPWPLDERWWDEHRHRRLARFQVVTADGAAHVVVVERQQWRVVASYA